jgi:pimeloyl-ACP methyl ester carboxylesterase
VPADYAQPEGVTISLPVVRARARNPAKRIGVMVFNFGGPGGATETPIVNFYPGPVVATTIDLTQSFDFVLMDWRGVDTTDPIIKCLDADTASRLGDERYDPVTDSDWMAFFQLVSDIGAGCSANPSNAPLLAHQDSESAARDLDALRSALGEDKLNMWMVSYGTRLGSMYAMLFPDHVRAIALDSPLEPAPTAEDFLLTQDGTFETALTRFFGWCARVTPTDCPFRTPDGQASSVAAAYELLLTNADTTPIVGNNVTLDRATINAAALEQMYFPPYGWPIFARALHHLSIGDGAPLGQLYAADNGSALAADNSFSSYENVTAQDFPLPSEIATPAGYEAWAKTMAAAAPHFGYFNLLYQAFQVGWPATVPVEHAIAATTAPPILITATRYDPATSYTWASKLQTALANGSYLVTYEGDGHASAQAQPCLGDVTAAFLLDPTTPPATTDCPQVDPTAPMSHAPAFRIGHRPRLFRTR